MIQSMTGFGKVEISLPLKKITIEIRALNSKSLELSLQIPYDYKEKEFEIRSIISNYLSRGKIDAKIFLENESSESLSKINEGNFNNYVQQIEKLAPSFPKQEIFKVVFAIPDVFKIERQSLSEDDWEFLKVGIEQALKNLVEFRKEEGEKLKIELCRYTKNIENLLAEVSNYEEKRIESIRERIFKSLKNLPEIEIDKNRFEQEIIYYLEKLDVTEEKTRLKSHIDYFYQTIENEALSGKKLGFIVQEIGREINTLGSKSNYAELQKIVVKMKDELEKMKEQLLNIL